MGVTVQQMLNSMAGQTQKAQQQGAAKQPLNPKAPPNADGSCPTCGAQAGPTSAQEAVAADPNAPAGTMDQPDAGLPSNPSTQAITNAGSGGTPHQMISGPDAAANMTCPDCGSAPDLSSLAGLA